LDLCYAALSVAGGPERAPMSSLVAFSIVAAILLGTMTFGFLAVGKIKMSPQELVIGNRSFGTILLALLLAGETITSFTFLGAAGWAYSRGAPAFYILAYLPLGLILLFLLGPLLWRRAREFNFLTNADYFASIYESRVLGLLVAVCGVFFLVLYLTVQLTGIQILLEIAGYGSVKGISAGAIAFFLIVIFVFFNGLRGVAWVSVIKDVLVLGAVLFAGIIIPIHFFGSPLHLFERLREAHPDWLTLRSGTVPNGTVWFVSTVLVNAVGIITWPHAAAAIYSAKDEASIRRNAMLLPFYQVILVLVLLAGFSALLVTPGLKGDDADQSFMRVVQTHYSAWVVGVVAGAGCLAGLVPGSSMILAAGSLIAKNIVGTFSQSFAQKHQTALTRISVLLVAVFAFVSWATARSTLVSMLLVAANGAAQFLPGILLSFSHRRPSALSIGSGLVVSLLFLCWTAAVKLPPISGINVGLVALVLNFAMVGLITLTRQFGQRLRQSGREPADH
jgi:solute:Na+ symporter, SSS family